MDYKLVIFDVEGVLLPKWRYIPFEVSRNVSISKFLWILIIGILYEIGVLSLEATLRRIYKNLKGYTLKALYQDFKKIPLTPGAKETIKRLKEKNYKIALISSSLPEIFIKKLAKELNADYAFGVKLKFSRGKFNGEIEGDVIKKNGKLLILKKIQKTENLTPKNCVLVADDRNNLQMFPYVDIKIGFNPDFVLSTKADYVITGELNNILPTLFKGESDKRSYKISRNDLIRLIIHMSGFLTVFPCIYLTQPYVMAVLILAMGVLYMISEFARIYGKNFPLFSSITLKAAKTSELYEFASAPIFYSLGIALPLLIFPTNIAYSTIAILTLGDGLAAITGKISNMATYPFNKAKHIEGTLVGLPFAFIGASLFLNPTKALLGAVIGMIIECLPLPINDNLTIPLITGLILTITPF